MDADEFLSDYVLPELYGAFSVDDVLRMAARFDVILPKLDRGRVQEILDANVKKNTHPDGWQRLADGRYQFVEVRDRDPPWEV